MQRPFGADYLSRVRSQRFGAAVYTNAGSAAEAAADQFVILPIIEPDRPSPHQLGLIHRSRAMVHHLLRLTLGRAHVFAAIRFNPLRLRRICRDPLVHDNAFGIRHHLRPYRTRR